MKGYKSLQRLKIQSLTIYSFFAVSATKSPTAAELKAQGVTPLIASKRDEHTKSAWLDVLLSIQISCLSIK